MHVCVRVDTWTLFDIPSCGPTVVLGNGRTGRTPEMGLELFDGLVSMETSDLSGCTHTYSEGTSGTIFCKELL